MHSFSNVYIQISVLYKLDLRFCRYTHPYEPELDRFEPSPEHMKIIETPEFPKSFFYTPLVYISEPHQLDELLEDLRQCSEFAVDVEHHNYRTFLGITCLIQISTSGKDYLIDAITLRDKLWMLNEVFTKPSIVKVCTSHTFGDTFCNFCTVLSLRDGDKSLPLLRVG